MRTFMSNVADDVDTAADISGKDEQRRRLCRHRSIAVASIRINTLHYHHRV